MNLFSCFLSTPFFYSSEWFRSLSKQFRYFSLVLVLLMLSLPGLTFAGGNSDSKKNGKSSPRTSSKSKETNRLKNGSKEKTKTEAYPSNCSEQEPNCADKIHPQISANNHQPMFLTTPVEVSDYWFDSILKIVGWKAAEPAFLNNFLPGPAAECPDGFKSLGGNFYSDPTVSVFKNKVFIFARGIDNALYYLVLEKGKKNSWTSLGGISISNPGSYFNDAGLFVEVTGTDGQKYHRQTTDGVTFTEWTLGSVNALTTNNKVGFRGSSLTFVKGSGQNPPLCYQVVKSSSQTAANNDNSQLRSKSTAGSKTSAQQTTAKSSGEQVAMRAPEEEDPCYWDPWDCEPPPPPTDQYSPVGHFDSIDVSGTNGYISGWSYDPDNPSLSNDVHIYFNGPTGSGTGYAVTAGNSRPDVNNAYGVPGNHGYYFQIPAQYLDGQQHVVYVYGIDTGLNSNSHLNNSPKYFTINPPPPATPTWGTVNSVSQSQLDVYWNGVTNATGYNVKMDGTQVHTNLPYLSAPFTNLAPGSTHSFEVQAVNQWGVSGWSSPLSGTTQPPVMPATPTWGTVNTISQTQLDVYWNTSANATAYNLRMDGTVIGTNLANTSFAVTNLAPGSTHIFEVQGVNQYGVSAWSSQRSGTTYSPPTATVSFVRTDTSTQGNWIGTYGGQGYKLMADGTSLPGWAQVSVSGQAEHTWAGSTTDIRSLKKAVNNGDRLAACWYSGGQYDILLNFTDGKEHQVAVYNLDWDNLGRTQELKVIDTTTSAVLDTRTVTSFGNGTYLVWKIKGQVTIRITNTNPNVNAVTSGVFVDDPNVTPTTAATNYAVGMPSQQSFTWQGLTAERAVDGNTDGALGNNSVTHTENNPQSWWQVDLGQVRPISAVKLWNRTDCCQERLNNFYVLVSDNPFTSTNLNTTLAQGGVFHYQITTSFNFFSEIPVNRSGRYVRVQLMNQDYLSLAEVQVLGTQTGTPTPTPTPTPGGGTNSSISRARLSPKNQTGGTSLYSRNFGWGSGLAGLSGRGLDAGFGISYNSLIWLKDGSNIVFNPNNDNVTPGFRFGFPVIEPQYADPLTGKNTFLMVTPSGSRVEFRQVTGTTDTFETADSGYIQLKVLDANNLRLTGTDGTNADYQLKNGAFRCASIKDSNGNYITINHDNNGRLQSVTDTLGRVINVAYDSGGQPTTITQSRANGTHIYATLTYTNITVNTNFSGLSLAGISNGATVKALQKITFTDGSATQFEYNSYGQVWRISNYAADNHKLNHTAVNLDNVPAGQTNCPRFSEFRNWAENFNLNASGVAQEVVIPAVYQENQTFTIPGGANATGTLLQVTAPDGTISKTFVGSSGWMEGLPIATEDWANNAKQRWSWTNYTQDDPNLAYILNPRPIETKIGDNSNVKRTTIEYFTQQANPQISVWGLVREVVQFDADAQTPLKRIHTEYNFDTNYTSRRIIGLPAESTLYHQTHSNLVSKVSYSYDEGDFSGTGQNISPIQHDNTNYGAGYSYRGNLTSATRWDATDPTNTGKAITSRVKYNTAGNPVSSLDPLNREIKTSYTDNFDDNQNRNTFAYPTQLTDPAGNSSTVKYRFDFGANVFAQSPAPAGQSVGKQTQRIYDSLGRLEKEIVLNTGAYTRYEYPTNGIHSKVYSTITDVNSNGADAVDEVLSESLTDGAGRVRQSRTEHPGSTGGWSATVTEYDIMGRVKRSTVPTEVDGNWNPAGDDATKGWTWNTQEYDWKGRVTRQINTDGTDKLISYEGCGCAGGQITTVSSEQLVEGRRRQKVYEDILGRTYKTETLNWDGSVYSTSKTTFNGRDQAILVRQYAGNDTSGTYQDTTMTYDGYGRLKTQHRPEQNSNTATTYNYYVDSRIQQVVDARGAAVNYTYNNLGLTTQVSTTSPNTATIPVTPTVTYTYDNLGNRTQMTDGPGNVTYEYNQLSQLTAETRQFNDSLPNAPLSNNRFRLEYGYSLSGQLKFYKDAYGQQINYAFDKTGRINSVTGSTAYDGVTTYANNPQYRAWGALKSLSYGDNPAQMSVTYNNRLLVSKFNNSKDYYYSPTGDLNLIDDTKNIAPNTNFDSNRFDRSFKYDHLGRTTQTRTGAEAHGGTDTPARIPYSENFTYDTFGHTTVIDGTLWGDQTDILYTPNIVNNRINNRTYDASGNEISGGALNYVYNADGEMIFSQGETVENSQFLDGDGAEIKRSRRIRDDTQSNWSTPKALYFIKSSVLSGQIINEVKAEGGKEKTNVYGSGVLIAYQGYTGGTNSSERVSWQHYDPAGMTLNYSSNNSNGPGILGSELNSLGSDVGMMKLISPPPKKDFTSPENKISAYTTLDTGGCVRDGLEEDCSISFALARNGGAKIDEVMSDPLALRRINYIPVYGTRPGKIDPMNDHAPRTEETFLMGYIFGTSWNLQIPPPPPPVEQKENENCILNAVPDNQGLGAGYDPTNGVHDGWHVLGGKKVIALPLLQGAKIPTARGGGDGTKILDITLVGAGKGYSLLLKDFIKITGKPGSTITAGQELGEIRTHETSGWKLPSLQGLHFSVIKTEFLDDYRALTGIIYSTDKKITPAMKEAADNELQKNTPKWFINPLGKDSPFKCNNAKTYLQYPIKKDGTLTSYPLDRLRDGRKIPD